MFLINWTLFPITWKREVSTIRQRNLQPSKWALLTWTWIPLGLVFRQLLRSLGIELYLGDHDRLHPIFRLKRLCATYCVFSRIQLGWQEIVLGDFALKALAYLTTKMFNQLACIENFPFFFHFNQGKLQLWVDIFPLSDGTPPDAVDVKPRLPVE